MTTHDNGRKPINVSTILTDLVTLGGREFQLVKCPTCSRWVQVHRHLIDVHRPDGTTRCTLSRQRLVFDLEPTDWAARYQGTADLTARRHVTRVHHKTGPAAPVPVCRPVPPKQAPVTV